MILTGTTRPGGSDTQIQFNNAGVLGGFGTWDGTDLGLPHGLTLESEAVHIGRGFTVTGEDAVFIGPLDFSTPVVEIYRTSVYTGFYAQFDAAGTKFIGQSTTADNTAFALGFATSSFAVLLDAGGSFLTATGEPLFIRAHDVDDVVDRTFATLTPGNTPSFAIAAPVGGTVSIDATTLSQGGHAIALTGALTRVGAHALTLTTTGPTNVTLPTTGTLATTGGSDTQIQFNNAGVLGGNADLTWDGTRFTAGPLIASLPEASAYLSGNNIAPRTLAVTALNNTDTSAVFAVIAESNVASPYGYIDAAEFFTFLTGSISGDALAIYTHTSGSGNIGSADGAWIYPVHNSTGTVGQISYLSLGDPDVGPGAGAIGSVFGLWAPDFSGWGAATAYYFWADSRGVYRIREDAVADGAGNPQAIPALYNPRFTKYTAGASNYERGVQQWVGNVYQMGAEAGGTGVQRSVQIIGTTLTAPTIEIPTGGLYVDTIGGYTGGTLTADVDLLAVNGRMTLTEAVGSSGLTITGATQTASFPALNITQTWNNAAVAFTGLKVNVTSTASAAASLLADFQVGSATKLSILKAGRIVTDSTYQTGGISGSDAPTGGVAIVFRGGAIEFMNSGNNRTGLFGGNGFNIAASNYYGWSPNSDAANAPDLSVYRDAADVFAQRRTTNAQTFRIYNTYTDASNYERLGLTWASNILHIGTANAGTGTARVMTLDYGGTTTAAISIPITSGAITFGGTVLVANADVLTTNSGLRSASMTTSQIQLNSGSAVAWSSNAIGIGASDTSQDTFLRRGGAAATAQLGTNVNGAAVAQTFKAHDGITGTDIAGANLTIAGGRGTGAGAPGDLIFSTATALGSGTTAQTLATRLTLAQTTLTFADAVNVALDTTTGTKFGTATTQKIGFYNATPIVQGASVADATGGAIIDAEARTAINALISRIEALGLIATI